MAYFTASLPTNANPNILIMLYSVGANRGQLLYLVCIFYGGGRHILAGATNKQMVPITGRAPTLCVCAVSEQGRVLREVQSEGLCDDIVQRLRERNP